MSEEKIIAKDRVSRSEKNKLDKQWYKDKTNNFDINSGHCTLTGLDSKARKVNMQRNYDLRNNIIDPEDYKVICEPFGDIEGASDPVTEIQNRDIITPKFKAMLGMAMKRPFPFKLIASNPEATTRRELEEVNRMKEFVISKIMTPIKQEIELKYQEELSSKGLTEERKEEIFKSVEEEQTAQTPEEVKKYMAREHQDPSEILFNQLLNIHKEKDNLTSKLNKCLEHGLTTAVQVMYVGVINKKMHIWPVIPINFNYEESEDLEFIQDGSWANNTYRWSPSKIVDIFGDSLSNSDIDKIHDNLKEGTSTKMGDLSFDFSPRKEKLRRSQKEGSNQVEVLHTVFTALRKIGFLTRMSPEGELDITIQDESYKLDEDVGDISIEWKWMNEKYETWRIGKDIFPIMQPLPGQYEDINNLGDFKLPYIGVVYDSDNSFPVSLIDRLAGYQKQLNVIVYRIDILMASDEGKKILLNINAKPDSSMMSTKEWNHLRKTSPFIFFDPNEEGTTYNDVNTMAKELDLSVMADISKYIEMAEYIRQQAGRSVGLTDNVEGQTNARESIGNNQQNLIQTSNILEPYFNLDSQFKKCVIQSVLSCCKVVYRDAPEETLSYILDDMSIALLKMDSDLINNTLIGIYVADTITANETKELLKQLSHAAMQNQTIDMSTVVDMYEQESLAQTKEVLKTGEREKQEEAAKIQERQEKADQERDNRLAELEEKNHERAKELIILKEEEQRKTEIIKGGIMAASFNPDQDKDKDGVNDFIEIAIDGVNAEIARDKNEIAREALTVKKQENRDKLEIEKSKLKANSSKM